MPFDDQLQQHLNRQTPAEPERRSEKPEPVHSGRVIVFNTEKRWGFIARGADLPDVFVHEFALKRAGIASLNCGDRVAFDIEANKRTGRPAAVNVRLLAA